MGRHAQRTTLRTSTRLAVAGVAVAGISTLAPAAFAAPDSDWDRLAQCESGGNWQTNTGNGYYGGLQFAATTWTGFGGGQFAAYAHQATREEQIVVAERVLASQGWGAWPACSRKLGLNSAATPRTAPGEPSAQTEVPLATKIQEAEEERTATQASILERVAQEQTVDELPANTPAPTSTAAAPTSETPTPALPTAVSSAAPVLDAAKSTDREKLVNGVVNAKDSKSLDAAYAAISQAFQKAGIELPANLDGLVSLQRTLLNSGFGSVAPQIQAILDQATAQLKAVR